MSDIVITIVTAVCFAVLSIEAKKDVIKYDYQILDDLHYFLTQGGYKIIIKQ